MISFFFAFLPAIKKSRTAAGLEFMDFCGVLANKCRLWQNQIVIVVFCDYHLLFFLLLWQSLSLMPVMRTRVCISVCVPLSGCVCVSVRHYGFKDNLRGLKEIRIYLKRWFSFKRLCQNWILNAWQFNRLSSRSSFWVLLSWVLGKIIVFHNL